jgi:hypothetical protein
VETFHDVLFLYDTSLNYFLFYHVSSLICAPVISVYLVYFSQMIHFLVYFAAIYCVPLQFNRFQYYVLIVKYKYAW